MSTTPTTAPLHFEFFQSTTRTVVPTHGNATQWITTVNAMTYVPLPSGKIA